MSAATARETAYLFVYGTLTTRARGRLGADMRARLASAATWLGPATAAGRLVRISDYPGLVAPVAVSDTVHGEVFELDDPGAVFAWLDNYEGVSANPVPEDEYERVILPARLASGDEITAWVYRYRGKTSEFPAIAGGRWDG